MLISLLKKEATHVAHSFPNIFTRKEMLVPMEKNFTTKRYKNVEAAHSRMEESERRRKCGDGKMPSSGIGSQLEGQNVLLVHSPCHVDDNVLAGSELLMMRS